MSNIELRNVVDVSCLISTPNDADIIEQILKRVASSYKDI